MPAIHRNRAEIRQIFLDHMPGVDPALTDEPRVLAMAARAYLRRTFLGARVAISGANFGVAETGTLAVVESEGNGRMCLTLPETLITVMGIEKLLPAWRDLEVFLQLLPRSSTGERMNPYTSLWTGVTSRRRSAGRARGTPRQRPDGGSGGRVGRAALQCIRCSACLNVCPVYERAGGHAYGSVYPGPIGAVLTPLLTGLGGAGDPVDTLPYASSLCGACFEACPVKIDIPALLVHAAWPSTSSRTGRGAGLPSPRARGHGGRGAWVMRTPGRFGAARAGRAAGRIARPRRPDPAAATAASPPGAPA